MGPLLYPEQNKKPKPTEAAAQAVAQAQGQGQGQGLVDQRTPQQAVKGLFTIPQSPVQQLIEEEGKGKFAAKMFANVLSGGLLTPALFGDLSGKQAEYREGIASYKAQQELMNKITEQESLAAVKGNRLSTLGQAMIDARQTPETEDDIIAANNYFAGGGTTDAVNRIAGKQAEYQVIDNNGVPTLFNKNDPASRGIPMLDNDGNAIHKAPEQWQVKNAASFDRMVPRLQDLDAMERSGVTIDRGKMTELRAMEQADAAGDQVLAARLWQGWVNNTLSPEEREYVLAAEDAGMITLRDESGAAISANEILRQMNQYLMFSDYKEDKDGSLATRQRAARNRKAQTLARDIPSYMKTPRKDLIEWTENFDPSLPNTYVDPADKLINPGENSNLPPMTTGQLKAYTNFVKNNNQESADRLLELVRLIAEKQPTQ